MDLYKWDYVVDASKTISGMITPTQAKVIKEAKTYACAFRQCFLREAPVKWQWARNGSCGLCGNA